MGNVLLPPEIDYRLERTMRQFNLPMNKVLVLWRIFNKYDKSRSGYITADDFFDNVIKYRQTCLTDDMFKAIQSRGDESLSFGEFVELITAFACFEKRDLVKYFFFCMDQQNTGTITKLQLKHFVHDMWLHDQFTNVDDGLEYLDSIDDGDGLFNFAQVYHMQTHYPVVLYPLYRLQMHVQRHTLGIRWWEAQKAYIIDEAEERTYQMHAELVRKEKLAAKKPEIVTQAMVRERMGHIRYVCMPWRRAAEKAHLLRIIAIEGELDAAYEEVVEKKSMKGGVKGGVKSV